MSSHGINPVNKGFANIMNYFCWQNQFISVKNRGCLLRYGSTGNENQYNVFCNIAAAAKRIE